MMKKLMTLLLALALVLSLVACGDGSNTPSDDTGASYTETPSADTNTPNNGDDKPAATPTPEPTSEPTPEPTPEVNAIPLQCGDNIENENFRMTFDSMEVLSEYSYSTGEYSSHSLYVEEGYKLVVVKGHFENKSTTVISDSTFAFSAVVNNTYSVDGYDVRLSFFRNKYFEIDPYTDLDYVLHINIPERLADTFETATFTIGFNDDMSRPTTVWNSDGTMTVETDHLYTLTNGMIADGDVAGNSDNTSLQTITIGDTVTTKDYEFTLENVELTYELLPSDTSSVYTSYPADSGKVYIHIAASLKNLMKRDIRIDETFIVNAIYGDDYTYNGFVVVDDGNRFDWVGSYSAATSLETAKMHGLIECPVEVAETEEKLVAVIKMSDGVEYQYIIR